MRNTFRIALLAAVLMIPQWIPPAHSAGSMYVEMCALEPTYPNYRWSTSTKVFGFYADPGILNTFSYDAFALQDTVDLANWNQTYSPSAPYDATYSATANLNPRVKTYAECNNITDRNQCYTTTGMITSPDRRIDSLNGQTNTTPLSNKTRYPVASGKRMSRRITAVGTSRMTSLYLNGVSITNGEGWGTYLDDNANSSSISQDIATKNSMFDRSDGNFYTSSGSTAKSTPDNPYLNCRPRNPSASSGYDNGNTTTVSGKTQPSRIGAFYRCQSYLQMDPTTGTSKAFYVYCSDSNTIVQSTTVMCKTSTSSSNSAWTIKTVNNPSQAISLNNSQWVGLTMECMSSSSCNADALRNRACNENWDPALSSTNFFATDPSW